jgi:hypothetical protein
VADTGGGVGPWDRVFKFDPTTGVRTEVGNLDEATGLPTDGSNRVYYGNAFLSTTNFGTINRTSSSGGQALYRQCGNSGTGANCYVFGIGLDPSLTDFGPDGRVYVIDACTFNSATMSCRTSNQEVRLVPPTGLIQTFASGLTFGNSPRGIVVDRNATSAFFRDVFVSDSTAVRRFSSSTVPGVLQKTYNSGNASIFSPRQMAITPFAPKERLLVTDDGIGRVVAIDPLTDKFKVIDIALTNPKTIALDQDGSGTTFAYVGEPTRVLKFPVHARTLYLAIWIADNVIQPVEVQRQISLAKAALEKCGFDLQIRSINGFSAGALQDQDVVDLNDPTKRCGNAAMTPTTNESDLLTTVRSSEPTDLNVYYVRKFRVGAVSPPPAGNAAETVTEDCFVGVMDSTKSGVIIDASAALQYLTYRDSVALLIHEIGHALIHRPSWGNDEHNDQMNVPYTGSNIMRAVVSRNTIDFDANQCGNIELDFTIFRGDP